MGKGVLSGYFLYCQDFRQAVKEELQGNAPEGTKVTVGEVAKTLGSRWKALPAED